jgi:cardiolipin synthase
MNIANIITIVRLLFTPLIIWLILSGYYKTSFIFFILCGLSDAIDGFIAKNLTR